MLKKITVALLAFSLAAGTLASCGNKTTMESTPSESSSKPSSEASVETESETSETTEVSDYTAKFVYLVAAEGSNQADIQEEADKLVCDNLGFHVELTPMTLAITGWLAKSMVISAEFRSAKS